MVRSFYWKLLAASVWFASYWTFVRLLIPTSEWANEDNIIGGVALGVSYIAYGLWVQK